MIATAPAHVDVGQVPAVTLRLLTGAEVEGGRTAGIFTVDDLIKILLYVRSSRKLPQTLTELQNTLGANSTGIAGLEPSDIVVLYQQITSHANRWTPVEDLVKEQATNLSLAAKDIVTIGNQILDVINKMDIIEQMETLGESTITIPITTAKDQQIQAKLPQVIAKLKQACVAQQEKSRKVLTAVRDYKIEISGGTLSNNTLIVGLEPTVAAKKQLAINANLDGTIDRLQKEIDALEKQIDQLQKDYDKYVGLSFTGAAGGIIGLAITGGIFGAKAEAARKERNQKIEDKEKKDKELAHDQQVQGMLNTFSTTFTDIGMRLLDAEQALLHLEFLWNDMVARIDQSVEKWANVKDSDMLMSFVTDLKGIIDPWGGVGDMSKQLLAVFDQAYEEFKKIYGE